MRRLAALRQALTPLEGVGACDHIGSTAVPGLAARASVDLQVTVPVSPSPRRWTPRWRRWDGRRTRAADPTPPGATRDVPAPGDTEPQWVWAERLSTSTDPAQPAILHVRLTASPVAPRTIASRDRLRAGPGLRAAYRRLEQDLAAEHAGATDDDDCARGRTAFVQAATS